MAERVFLASPLATGRGGVIVSPFQFILTDDDHLQIEGWNSATDAVLEVSYRHAALDGQIRATHKVIPLTNDRVQVTTIVPLAEGYIVNMEIHVSGATPQRGQTFCCVKLIRGLTGATFVLGLLLQGYVTAEQGLGWPGSPIESSLAGAGYMRRMIGTLPVPPGDIYESIPTGARWRLHSFRTTYFTDATAGNRVVVLMFTNAAGAFLEIPNITGIAPSGGLVLQWIVGVPFLYVPMYLGDFMPLPPDLLLFAVNGIGTRRGGGGIGDHFDAPSYTVEEWLEAA